jgi:5-methylcytosine-specific restriction endonuclease McrA
MKYSDKFKDPRWQKKRLEVLELNYFQCESCGDASRTLNVHHKFYVKGRDPWEYISDDLACLCDGCHKEYHNLDDRIKFLLVDTDIGTKEEVIGFLLCALGYKNMKKTLNYEGLIGWIKYENSVDVSEAENYLKKAKS